MNSKRCDRRRFLKNGAMLAGMAVGAVSGANSRSNGADGAETTEAHPKDARSYGVRSRFVTSERLPSVPVLFHEHELLSPLQDSVGIITPSGLHFMTDHGGFLPDINPKEHRLMVHGMVERPLIFTVDELKRLPSTTGVYFIECNANSRPQKGPKSDSIQQVHGRASCSEWTGVALSLLLKQAGVKKGASWVVAEGGEPNRYTKSIPLTKAMEDVLVAYAQNGEPIRPEQGFPLRLVNPGWEGIGQVKWLGQLKVVDQPSMARWEASHANEGPDDKAHWFRSQKGPKSLITFPSGGQQLSGPGFYEITGLAFTGGGVIRRVEVSVDGGKSWQEGKIQGPVHPMAFTRFRFGWNWNGEETVIQSRCVDEQGEAQPTIEELGAIMGVKSDFLAFFQNLEHRFDNFNAIQPWRIDRDGSVHNALA